MLYKRIVDEDKIIYCTEQSDIYITNADKEDKLRDLMKEQIMSIEVQPYDLDEKKWKLKKLIILLSTACNLRCRYCYLNYGDYTKEEKIKNIDIEQAKRAIDMIIEKFPEGIGFIQFFGGEPLLAFHELQSIYYYINKVCDAKKIELPKFGLVTNGLLLNHEMVTFFNEHRFSVTISIDGGKDIHNLVRIKADHSDSFHHIAEIMEDYREDITFPLFYEMTLNREHVLLYTKGKMKEWLDAIKNLGFTSGIVGVVEFSRDKSLDFKQEDIPVLNQMYEEIVDYFFDELLKDTPYFYNLDICKLVWLLLKKNITEVCCATGVNQYTLSADGYFYPCPKFADCNKKVGSVDENYLEDEEMRQLMKEDKREQCENCWLHYICKSYCYALKYRNKDNRAVIPIRCIHMDLLTENVVKNIVRLKKNGTLQKVTNAIKLYWNKIR